MSSTHTRRAGIPGPHSLGACLLLALSLDSCGGGGGGGTGAGMTYSVGGSLSGLATGMQVTLQDNGADSLTIPANGIFTFPTHVTQGGSYQVTVSSQPAEQACSVSNGSGSNVAANVSNVAVSCSNDAYTIGGRLTGLASGQQITLLDNGADPVTLSGIGAFSFPVPVAYGANYSVTVGSQPSQQFCSVNFGTGTVSESGAVDNVVVTCANLQVLYSFTSASGLSIDGRLTIDGAGNLYGIMSDREEASNSGPPDPNTGVAFKLSPAAGGGYTETDLYDFAPADESNGESPRGGLIMDAAGNLYGTTLSGGSAGWGTVFKLATNGGGGYTESVLYNFPGGSGGSAPTGGVIIDGAGNLFGTTNAGGANSDGTVFKLSPGGGSGYTASVLYSFADDTGGWGSPAGSLIMDNASNLYGATVEGGTYFYGVVFELSPSGGTYSGSIVYAFASGNNGELNGEDDLFMGSAGSLWVTRFGGNNVLKLSPGGGGTDNESFVYQFMGGYDGSGPTGGVVEDSAGNLYGITSQGADVNGTNYYGTIFELSPNGAGGYTESVLFSFTGGADGGTPQGGLLIDSAGNLYGATSTTVWKFRLH